MGVFYVKYVCVYTKIVICVYTSYLVPIVQVHLSMGLVGSVRCLKYYCYCRLIEDPNLKNDLNYKKVFISIGAI